MKIVLDSNVLVAALASQGLCASLLEVCLKHDVFMSDAIYHEVEETLRKKTKIPPGLIRDTIQGLQKSFQKRTPDTVPHNACRDPKDLHVLGLAQAVNADVIITGDQDLLVLKRFHGILILSPREFYLHLQK